MNEIILLLQLISTFTMVGLIWFVQVVHYPLFGKVGANQFYDYEQSHQQRTTLVVAPLMLTEAITALALVWIHPATIPMAPVLGGVFLVGVNWASTFFWQVPFHQRLSKSFDAGTHRKLVQSNWLRTIAWTARGILVCWLCLRFITDGTAAIGTSLP